MYREEQRALPAYEKPPARPVDVYYMKLVCENEDMALYFDDLKTLDMRAVSAVNGTLLGVCSYGSNATFTNIHMYIPG